MFHTPWSAALQEQPFIVAILQLRLWTRLRLYIDPYPLAVAALLTNTPGTPWHSQKVTLSVLKPGGTDSHRRKGRADWLEGYKRKKKIGPLQRKVTAVECAFQSTARVSSVRFQHLLVHKVYRQILIGFWKTNGAVRSQIMTFALKMTEKWKKSDSLVKTAVPSPHQRMLEILSEGLQRPWALALLGLDCDTFGWCILARSRWTSFKSSLGSSAHKHAVTATAVCVKKVFITGH